MANDNEKNSLFIYFIVIFILTLPLYLLVALTSMTSDFSPDMAFPFIALAALIPISVAVILTLKKSGKEGFKKLLKRSFDFKKITKKIWIVPTFFLFPLIFVSGYVILIATGQSFPSAQFPMIAIPILFVLFFIMAFGEEEGWMGYAFDPLQRKYGFNKATLILGSIWAIWHIPFYIFMMGDLIPIIILPLCLLGMRIILVSFYKSTGKSVFIAILFHTMYNVTVAIVPNYYTSLGLVLTCLLIAISALIFIYFGRGKSKAMQT